jgi:hypothetical protein
VDSAVSSKQGKIFFENFDHTQIFSRLQLEPADINYNEKIYQDQLISLQILEFSCGINPYLILVEQWVRAELWQVGHQIHVVVFYVISQI